MTGEGRVSFPEKNTEEYVNNANHFMLISRASGQDFALRRTFLDMEKEKDFITIFEIKDGAEQTWLHCKYL